MEKNEKIEVLTKVMDALELQAGEVVAYWQKTEKLKTAEPAEKTAASEQSKDLSGITLLPSKKIVTPKIIRVGMFMYEDGLIFPEIIKGNQITSVVGYVGKNEGLSVCLKEKKLPWSSDVLYVGMKNNLSGKEATQLIVEEARREGKKAEAAQYCFEYAEDGVKAGGAFLASKEELGLVYPNKKQINAALDMLHAIVLNEMFYWSSPECNSSYAWGQSFSGGIVIHRGIYKAQSYYVRPVLAFTF